MADVEEYLEYIEKLIKEEPDGLLLPELFKKATDIDDRTLLSRVCHRLEQFGKVYKKDSLLFHVDNASSAKRIDPVTKEIRQLISKDPTVPIHTPVVKAAEQPRVFTVKEPKTIIPPLEPKEKQKEKPFGDLRKSATLGAAAYCLYKYREERPLFLNDIITITKANKLSMYAALTKLIVLGYAEKDDTNVKKPLFKWSNKFRYPFAIWAEEDKRLIHILPKDYFATKPITQEVVNIPPEEIKVETTNIKEESKPNLVWNEIVAAGPSIQNSLPAINTLNKAIELIDFQISTYENFIHNLKQVRQMLI